MNGVTFADLLQLGFAGAMAFVLVFIIYQMNKSNNKTYKDIHTEHKQDINSQQENYRSDIKKLSDEHRAERKEFYDKFHKMADKFDETIRLSTMHHNRRG